MSWRPRRDFPWLADTSANVHLFMPFDADMPGISALATSDAPVYMVWGFNSGRPDRQSVGDQAAVPPRSTGTRTPAYYPQAHDLAWYQANHPDCIEYQCDRTTVAYEFGDPNVPLDTTNPSVEQYIEQTYIEPTLAAGTGYDGIAFDNLRFNNGGTWSGQRCGHYDSSGNWVQQYNGTANDPAYRAAVFA
jgi:hypothetical protein